MDRGPEESRRARILLPVLLGFAVAQAAILVPVRPGLRWGMLAEDLLLLLGTWLLSGSLFRSAYTRFFLSAAVLGSTLWMDPAARCFTVLPLVLAFARRFLETGARSWAAAAGLLAVVPLPGQPPSVALLVPLAAALCWIGAALLWGDPLLAKWRGLRWSGIDSLLAAAVVLAGAVGAVVRGPVSDGPSGTPTFQAWLVASGFRDPFQYLDFAVGLSPGLGATVFCGMFTAAFALCALADAGGRRCLLLLAFLAVSLALIGLAALSFPSAPPAAGVAFVRLVVIALAGLGFERRLHPRESGPNRVGAAGVFLLVVAAVSAGLSLVPGDLYGIPETVCRLLTPGSTVEPRWPEQTRLLGASALMAGAAGAVLILRRIGGRRSALALALLLVLHPLDTFGWRFRHEWARSSRATAVSAAPGDGRAECRR